MDSRAPELSSIRFGSFEADLAAGELRKNGVRLKLQGQPLEVLAALLERPGKTITREELKERLWSSDTFVDFDRGLNTAVNKIRETLGDSASTPRFVQTIPRCGYRFIAPVDGAPTAPAEPALKPGWSWIAAAVAAIMMVALPLWIAARNGAPDSNSLTVTPLTSYAGSELQPSFSPDGSQVVFAGGEDHENCDIFVKQIGVDQPSPLATHPDHEFSPAWSPTGTHIAFLRALSASLVQLVLIPQRGGPEQILAEFPAVWQLARPATYDHLLAWDPEGNWIITSGADEKSQPVGLFAIHVESRQRHRLTWPDGSQRDTAPTLSPDGRSLVFARYTGAHRSDLHLLRLSENMKPVHDPVALPRADMENHYPAWTADGNQIVFAAGSFWNDSLWIMEPSERAEPRRLGVTGGWQPTISRSQDRLVFAKVARDYNIWRASLPGPGEQPLPPSPFLDSTYADLAPDYSPDGKRVAFVSMRSGWLEIWLCDADGSHLEQLTSFGGPYLQWPKWSPGGKKIAFYAEEEGNSEIYTIDVARRTTVRLTDHPGWDGDPRWSRDGKWIYFISDRGGPRGAWKMPASGGMAVPLKGRLSNLSIAGIPGPPLESTDGKQLYFLHGQPRVNSAWRIPVGGGEEVLIVDELGTFPSLGVAEDGLYFVGKAGKDGVEPIQYLDFASGHVKTVAKPTVKVPFSLSVSPDRRTLLYCQRDGAGSDLMLVEDFR